jgi:hypothetical protein
MNGGVVFDMGASSSNGAWLQTSAPGGIQLSAHYPILLNPNGGTIGINTTSPNNSYALDVAGDINASGNVRASGVALTSDERLKIDIVPVENSLEKIQKLKGVNYYWKDKAKRGSNLQLGVIAQDVEKVFPEAVLTDKEGSKSVLYTSLIGPIVNAIKELYAKFDQQSKTIAELKSENLALKAKVELVSTSQSRAPASLATTQELSELKARADKAEKENAAMKSYLCSKDPSAPICK